MAFKKFVAGYVSGWIALFVEILFLAGSFLSNALMGIFPESASNLTSTLSTAATVNFLVNLIVGLFGAFDVLGFRWYAIGFLSGVLTVLALFGGLLNLVAPQIVSGLWGEFLTVLIPIIIVLVIVAAYNAQQNRQGYGAQWY